MGSCGISTKSGNHDRSHLLSRLLPSWIHSVPDELSFFHLIVNGPYFYTYLIRLVRLVRIATSQATRRTPAMSSTASQVLSLGKLSMHSGSVGVKYRSGQPAMCLREVNIDAMTLPPIQGSTCRDDLVQKGAIERCSIRVLILSSSVCSRWLRPSRKARIFGSITNGATSCRLGLNEPGALQAAFLSRLAYRNPRVQLTRCQSSHLT